jgi:isocitrate dehydrogenase
VYPLPQIGSFAELIKTAVSSGARHCGQGHRQSARNDPFGFSEAMMLRYSLDRPEQAARVENAVKKVLKSGLRTGDIWEPGRQRVGTREMGDAVLKAL